MTDVDDIDSGFFGSDKNVCTSAGVVFVMVAGILSIAFSVMTLAPVAIGMVVVIISDFPNMYDDDDFRFEFLVFVMIQVV